jgi:hypothetical protein
MKHTFSTPIASLAVILALPSSLLAETGKLPAEAQQQMLKTLTELEGQLGGAKQRKVAEALKAFETASAKGDSAYNLWLDCKKSVDFDEKGKTAADFGEWKRSEGSQYHEPEHTKALQFQLQYLVLTLKATLATKDAEVGAVMAQLPTFHDAVLADWKQMKKYSRVLRESAVQSVFAKFFKLDQILELPETWSPIPGDIDSAYDVTILPYLKQSKNLASLTAAWNKRINQVSEIFEIEVAQEKQAEREEGKGYVPKGFNPASRPKEQQYTGNAEERLAMFKKDGLPRLQWRMNVDMFQLGSESTSSQTMLGILKSNLGHPDAEGWLGQLTALLKGEPLPVSSPENAAAGGTPPAK